MYNEGHYYFNGTALNRLVCDAGYDGIKDFVERSDAPVSYKTLKRACNNSYCTKRTLYAIAITLAKPLHWSDPMGELKTEFSTERVYEEECRKEHYEELAKESARKYEKDCDKKLEQCIVYLTDGREALVQGKSIYWSWFDDEKTICFYDEDGCNDGDLKIAEFNKACVIGIVKIIEE